MALNIPSICVQIWVLILKILFLSKDILTASLYALIAFSSSLNLLNLVMKLLKYAFPKKYQVIGSLISSMSAPFMIFNDSSTFFLLY